MPQPQKYVRKAFTLIELMVVIAIVALLASFGLPAYQDYIKKTRVAEALQKAAGLRTQIIDNAMNGLPLSSGQQSVAALSTKYADISVQPATGQIVYRFYAKYFDGIDQYLYQLPLYDTPGTPHNLLTSGTIPPSNIYWACVGAPGWTSASERELPAKYLPEACKVRYMNGW